MTFAGVRCTVSEHITYYIRESRANILFHLTEEGSAWNSGSTVVKIFALLFWSNFWPFLSKLENKGQKLDQNKDQTTSSNLTFMFASYHFEYWTVTFVLDFWFHKCPVSELPIHTLHKKNSMTLGGRKSQTREVRFMELEAWSWGPHLILIGKLGKFCQIIKFDWEN